MEHREQNTTRIPAGAHLQTRENAYLFLRLTGPGCPLLHIPSQSGRKPLKGKFRQEWGSQSPSTAGLKRPGKV